MAFMIPVVRNDWDVWMGTGNPRLGKNPRIGQVIIFYGTLSSANTSLFS